MQFSTQWQQIFLKKKEKKVFFGPRVDESSYKHGFKESGPHFLSKWKINV